MYWRTVVLEHFFVNKGYEVCDSDLIAITRLRGASLKTLAFPMCCISMLYSPIEADEGYYDDVYPDGPCSITDYRWPFYLDQVPDHIQSKVIEDIAEPLNRKWSPLSLAEMPKAVINRFEDMQATYLSTLVADQTICGECGQSRTQVSSNPSI